MARSAKKRAAALGDILSGAGEAPLCCCFLQDLPSRAVPAAIYAPRAASPLPRRPAPRIPGLDFSKVATWKGLTCADSTRSSASPLVGCQRPALPGRVGKPSEGLGAARGPGAETLLGWGGWGRGDSTPEWRLVGMCSAGAQHRGGRGREQLGSGDARVKRATAKALRCSQPQHLGVPGVGDTAWALPAAPRGQGPLSRGSPALSQASSGCHWMSPLCCASPRQPRACPHGHPQPGVAAHTRVCPHTCTAPSQPLQPWPPLLGDFSTPNGGEKNPSRANLGTRPLPAATPPLTFAQAPSEAAVGEGIKWEAGAAPTEQSPGTARPGEWGSPRKASGLGWAPGTGQKGLGMGPLPTTPHHVLCSLPSHEGLSPAPAHLRGRPGSGST